MPEELKREDVVATQESREEAEQSVVYPETDTRTHKFLSYEISLRALPIIYAKKVNNFLKEYQKDYAKIAGAVESKKDVDSLGINIDESTITALLNTVEVICNFYKLGVSREDLEMEASTIELAKLAEAQLEVNGRSDFLLSPLRIITQLMKLQEEASRVVESEEARNQLRNSLSSNLSATGGGSPSTN